MPVWLGICAVFALVAAWSAWVPGAAPVAEHPRRMLLPAAGGVLMIAAGSAGAFWQTLAGQHRNQRR